MGYENPATYDKTDGGGNLTIAGNKVSWNDLDRDETSHISDSKGVNHFSGDFEHLFEIQLSDRNGVPCGNWWVVANAQSDLKALIDGAANAAYLQLWGTDIEFFVLEGGAEGGSGAYGSADSTTYYITLKRDDDGGANNTGQYEVEIRTGSHTVPPGTLEDTLTRDCAAGGQFDFEFIYFVQSYDDAQGGNSFDGFTENLDLQEAAPPAGIPILRRRRECA